LERVCEGSEASLGGEGRKIMTVYTEVKMGLMGEENNRRNAGLIMEMKEELKKRVIMRKKSR